MGLARENIRDYFTRNPCADCGESDPIVLEFDHVHGDKRHNISNMVRAGYKWDSIVREIDKCEVRCANCHKRKTAERGKYWYIV